MSQTFDDFFGRATGVALSVLAVARHVRVPTVMRRAIQRVLEAGNYLPVEGRADG